MSDASDVVRVLGIAGSLRARSYNRALLGTACTLVPAGMEITIAGGIGELPLYNDDLDPATVPAVAALRRRVVDADAVLMAVPEYNTSIAAPLKNALDWLSRPRLSSPLYGKPVGMFGASQGPGGTVRAHTAMREALYYLNARVQPPPELLVAFVQHKVDEHGVLHDDATREALRQHLASLLAWTRLWLARGDG